MNIAIGNQALYNNTTGCRYKCIFDKDTDESTSDDGSFNVQYDLEADTESNEITKPFVTINH